MHARGDVKGTIMIFLSVNTDKVIRGNLNQTSSSILTVLLVVIAHSQVFLAIVPRRIRF